jgi:hypothetical protein
MEFSKYQKSCREKHTAEENHLFNRFNSTSETLENILSMKSVVEENDAEKNVFLEAFLHLRGFGKYSKCRISKWGNELVEISRENNFELKTKYEKK